MKEKTFEELKLSGNMPSPAGVGMKILQLTRTEEFSAVEMGKAIMADSSLSGRILELANSASNAGLEPATTVSEAIMRLGSRTVRDLALAFSLVSDRRVGRCRQFDYEAYWSRSLARAVAAQVISRASGFAKPETAYICGLLGEIGKLALASVYPEDYGSLLLEVGDGDPEALLEREDARFDIDHAQVAACLLNDWGLPESLAEAVHDSCRSRRLEGTAAGFESLATLLRFAHVVAESCMASEGTGMREWARLGAGLDLLRARLGMEPEGFVRLCDTCVDEWISWGASLDIGTEGCRFAAVLDRVEEARRAVAGGHADELPAPRDAPAAARPSETEASFAILAVARDAACLQRLARHLQGEDYRVDVARGGKEGLKVALSRTPDIVIAERDLPDLDGLEMCRSLRRTAAGASMYFLLLTESAEEDAVVEALDAGVDELVTKPFAPRLLSARIKGGVRFARLQRKIARDQQTMRKQVADLNMMTRKLRKASLTDPLTELPNRRYAMKRLDGEWASVRRTMRPMSVMMIDIDRFKSVNDAFGHDVGDAVLREIARVLDDATRATDEVCRMGGEEFLIICRNTDENECIVVAERVRSAVEGHIVQAPSFQRNVTVSIGVACTELGCPDVGALYRAADDAVYLAKASGRNQVRRATELSPVRESA